MKKYLVAGLLTLLPFAITVSLFIWIFDFLTEPFLDIANYVLFHLNPSIDHEFQGHEFWAKLLSRVFIVICFFFVVLLLGLLARRYFFKYFIALANNLFTHIPIIKTIYSLTKDISKSMLTSNEKPFKQTSLVPFPNSDALAIGLVTGEVPDELKPFAKEAELTVFVPTSPHPISGFLLLYPQKLVKPIDVSTEDAFKFIISCGSSHFSHPLPSDTPKT